MNRAKSFWLVVVLVNVLVLSISGVAMGQNRPEPRQIVNPKSGKTQLLTFDAGALGLAARDVRGTALATSAEMIGRYASAFGASADSQYQVLAEPFTLNLTAGGATAVRYRQTLGGIPVYAGQLIVNVRGDGAATVMSGEVSSASASSLKLSPSISAAVAGQSALTYVAQRYGVSADSLVIEDAGLWVYDPTLVKPGVGAEITGLVWQAVISSKVGQPIRVVTLVDAETAELRLSFNKIHASVEHGDWQSAEAAGVNFGAGLIGAPQANTLGLLQPRVPGSADLATYDGNNLNALPGTFLCDETQIPCTSGGSLDADANSAHFHAKGTYDFYWNTHGRDSLNNAGMQLISTVHTRAGYCNAFWNSTQMAYGDGCSSSIVLDDVVAHELTHGVTEFSSNLIYAYDSGAINESFSDVWGEYYDLTNSTAEDIAANRWVVGEELVAGGIRNMKNPTLLGDPDRVGSANFWTDARDVGGVHINSGINNKAAYLIADGDTFNGQTITGIGLVKPLHIYYYVQTMLASESSDYNDLGVYLNTACTALIGGGAGITVGDCTEVSKAVLATEMALPSPHLPDSVDACSTGFEPSDLFFDDFENAATSATKWTTSIINNTNAWTISSASSPLIGTGSMRADNLNALSNSVSALTNQLTSLPANAYLHFNQQYLWEYDGWDGGVVQYSTNNGSTWTTFNLASMEGEVYPGLANGDSSIPFAGQYSFTGDSFGAGSTRINLSSLSGQNLKIRFYAASDESFSPGNPDGWWIDNVRIYTCQEIPDQAGVTVNPTTAEITEGGVTDSYTVVLDSQPTGNVTITVGDTADCTASADTLTFTTANWNNAQTVTLTAVDDSDVEGTETCTITHSAASSDSAYNGISVASVTVTVTDNDSAPVAGVTVNPTTAEITEGGVTDTYTVVLDSQPTGDVTITVGDTADCTASVDTLTFTTANWNNAQTVTLTAVDDSEVEGTETCPITHGATSSDSAYNGISIAGVTVTVTDNDGAPTTEELLTNGDFETAGVAGVPQGWTVQAQSGDKRACPANVNNVHGGACAFKFTGSTTDKSKLIQVVDLTGVTLNAGDTLTASAYFKGNHVSAKIKLMLFVYYTGNPTPVKTVVNILRNPAYTLRSTSNYVLTSGSVSQIKLVFNHLSSGGNSWIDDASLILTPSGSGDGVLGLPEAEGFRN